MTKMLIRRVPAVVLTVAILFTTVFALSISASALTFTPRYSMPNTDNEYYYSSKNPFYSAGYGLPNCTAYAYGRIYEITGKRPNLSTGNAENWYGYNQSNGYYEYGQTPRLGAIACWSYGGSGGHVAVVEYIDSSTGEMVLSNSAWSARYGSCEPFYLTRTTVDDPQAGGSSWWYFQGYIYAVDSPDVVVNPDNSGSGTGNGGNNPVVIGGGDDGDDTPSIGKNYAQGVYQVQVDDYLTMRTGAGTRYSFVTRVLDGAKLQVTAVKKNDDLTWGETSYDGWDGWVALNYCKYLGGLDTWKEETTEAPTEPATEAPTTAAPTEPATTIPEIPTEEPTTAAPTTVAPTTVAPTTAAPVTVPEVPTEAPTTQAATEPDYSKGIGTGDVNADGVIDIVDATLIQKAAAGFGDLSAKQLKWCDFDFDGKITISDATLVQKIAIGMYNYYL